MKLEKTTQDGTYISLEMAENNTLIDFIICGMFDQNFTGIFTESYDNIAEQPATVAKSLLVENSTRKKLLPSEMVAVTETIREELRAEAKYRQISGLTNTRVPECQSEISINGRVNDDLAIIAGVSRKTLEKANYIVNASQNNPQYMYLVKEMDKTGRIDGVYKKLKKLLANQ